MPPSLSELKVTPSFCFAFKIPDDHAVTNTYTCVIRTFCKQALHSMAYIKLSKNLKKCIHLNFDVGFVTLQTRPLWNVAKINLHKGGQNRISEA